MIRLAIATGRSLDELLACSVNELELMEEEQVRAQAIRQLQMLDAAALGARAAQSPAGVQEFNAERRRLLAVLQPATPSDPTP